jgi:flagellar biosynthesis/type III secretory pathway M-ring protein FliF/YscJ
MRQGSLHLLLRNFALGNLINEPFSYWEAGMMSSYETWNLVLQAVIAIFAFVTLIFLYRQVRAMVDQIVATQEATRAQSALALANFLQAAEVREARRCVREQLSKKHHSDWTEEEKRCANLVCANYDVAAGLIRKGLVPADLFVKNWGPSVLHCHQVLSPHISELRAKPGGQSDYWANFDWLRGQAGSTSV